MKYKLFAALLFPLVTVAAELKAPEMRAMSVVDQDGQNNFLYLGNGYNSDTFERKQFPCVSGNPIEAGNVLQKISASHNLSFEEARSIVAGNLSVGVSSPLMSVGADAEWAYQVASTNLAQSINMTIFYQPRKTVLQPNNITIGAVDLTSTCQYVVDNRQDLLIDNVGNEFITSINSIASLSVTMTLTSANKSDKDLLAGALKFSRTGISFEGNLQDIVGKLNSSTRINLNIRQSGGEPSELIQFGANNGQAASNCAMAVATNEGALNQCMSIFNNVLTYARNDFKQQLQSIDDYAIASYNTSRYDTSGLDELVPSYSYELVSVYREMKLAELAELYKKSRQDNIMANYILSERSGDWPDAQLQPLRVLSNKALDNSVLAHEIMNHCEIQPYGTSCVDRYNSDIELVEQYDDGLLNI
jgi:hypothetical protein